MYDKIYILRNNTGMLRKRFNGKKLFPDTGPSASGPQRRGRLTSETQSRAGTEPLLPVRQREARLTAALLSPGRNSSAANGVQCHNRYFCARRVVPEPGRSLCAATAPASGAPLRAGPHASVFVVSTTPLRKNARPSAVRSEACAAQPHPLKHAGSKMRSCPAVARRRLRPPAIADRFRPVLRPGKQGVFLASQSRKVISRRACPCPACLRPTSRPISAKG